MRTPEHRRAADRHGLRYPSDLTDAEWALIEPAAIGAKKWLSSSRAREHGKSLSGLILLALRSCPNAGSHHARTA
jgi:hypothetical protein